VYHSLFEKHLSTLPVRYLEAVRTKKHAYDYQVRPNLTRTVDDPLIRRHYLHARNTSFALKPKQVFPISSVNIGTKRERAFTAINIASQNKKRILKMLEKSMPAEPRQRHLLSKRTRVAPAMSDLCSKEEKPGQDKSSPSKSATDKPQKEKQVHDKQLQDPSGQDRSHDNELKVSGNKIENDNKEVLLRMLNAAIGQDLS
jgi:hypothetical protein